MNSAGELTESRSISCPFCGRRSTLSIELPVTTPKTWTHHCPTCGKPWKVSLGSRRGIAQLDVSPIIASKPKKKAAKAKAPAKSKTTKKAKTVKKAKKAKRKR